MRAGTIILAASGAPDERKSHEAMSAPMSNMDPNEVPNAAKKVTSHLLWTSVFGMGGLRDVILPL